MQRIVQLILSRLDLRLVRLSEFHRMYNDLAAAKLTIPKLEGTIGKLEAGLAKLDADLRLALELSPPRADQDRRSEANPLLNEIAIDDGSLDAAKLARICEAYSELQSVEGRESISKTVLRSASAGVGSASLLTDPATAALASHELVRQLAAAMSFWEGHLDEAYVSWTELTREVPTPLNHLCAARVAIAQGDTRAAFSILVEAVHRFPLNVSLELEFATLFLRLGDTDGANAALEPIRHRFVEERNILAEAQAALDRAIATDSTDCAVPLRRRKTERTSPNDQRSEYRNSQAIVDASLQRTIARIAGSASITKVIEYGVADRSSLAALAHGLPHIKFAGFDPNQDNPGMSANGNLESLTGNAMDSIPAETLGPQTLLLQTQVSGHFYPARLAQLYRRCAERDLRHIVIVESVDFDRVSLRYHESGSFPRVTELGRGGYLLHDFKRLLGAANYEIAEAIFLPPALLTEHDELHECHRVLHATLRG